MRAMMRSSLGHKFSRIKLCPPIPTDLAPTSRYGNGCCKDPRPEWKFWTEPTPIKWPNKAHRRHMLSVCETNSHEVQYTNTNTQSNPHKQARKQRWEYLIGRIEFRLRDRLRDKFVTTAFTATSIFRRVLPGTGWLCRSSRQPGHNHTNTLSGRRSGTNERPDGERFGFAALPLYRAAAAVVMVAAKG